MFGHQNRVFSKILLAADISVGLMALALSYWLRTLVWLFPVAISQHFNPVLLPFPEYFSYFLAFLPIWVILLSWTQRYGEVFHLPATLQAYRVLQFVVPVGFLQGFFIFAFKLEISRPLFFGFLALATLGMGLNRFVLEWILRSRNINPHNQTNILIVGTTDHARRVAEKLGRYRRWGVRVIGHLSNNGEEAAPGLTVLGALSDLPDLILDRVVADEIVFVGSDITDVAAFEEMIKLCEDLGVRTRVAADFFPTSIARVSVDSLEALPMITFSSVPDDSLSRVAKRVVDFVVALGGLALFTPLMILIAFLIKFTSPGPVLYKQTRCGLFGRRFTLIKFRTMVEGAEDQLWEIRHLNEMSGPVFKMRDDPRVTPLGRYLRKFSLDELPQFWNVIKGEMSIVGPRAPLPEEVRAYSIKQRRRLSVKPGITCLWQVSGRSEVDFTQWMALDLEYIDNWSLWLDFRIMLRTIPAVFTGRGAR